MYFIWQVVTLNRNSYFKNLLFHSWLWNLSLFSLYFPVVCHSCLNCVRISSSKTKAGRYGGHYIHYTLNNSQMQRQSEQFIKAEDQIFFTLSPFLRVSFCLPSIITCITLFAHTNIQPYQLHSQLFAFAWVYRVYIV